MVYSKKILAGAMAAAMLVAACLPLTSCKGKRSEVKLVSEDDPWYDMKRVVLDPGFDTDLFQSIQPSDVYMCHDKYVVTYELLYSGEENKEYLVAEEKVMCIFDNDGSLLHTVDLDDIMASCPAIWNVYFVRQCCEAEDGIRFYFSDTFRNVYYADIDENTGLEIGSPQKLDLSMFNLDTNDAIDRFEIFGDYQVMTFYNVKSPITTMAVAKDGVPQYKVDVEKELGPGELTNIFSFFGGRDGTVNIQGYGKTITLVNLDLATGHLTRIEGANPSLAGISTSGDGTGYLTKTTGIFEYDPQTGVESSKFSFDNCNINRNECFGVSVLSLDENKVVLSLRGESAGYFRQIPEPAVVYTFEKADRNPNAGKKVIRVATLSSLLDRNEGVALQMFNEQSSEYYAKLVVYDTGDLSFAGDSYSIDEMDRQSYSAAAMIYGSLISDIRSGTGPDVILGAQGSIELLDSTYLMDMTPYLQSESFDASKYYMNIIEASKIDGKAFFIPTMFSFMGIATDSSRLEDGQKGFTYEQYAAFVKEQLNGVEPVTQATSRMHFMNLCLENSYTDWFKNDKVDFDRDEFREMAVFFKDNVPEGVTEGLGARVAEFSFPLFITDKNSGPKRVGDSLRTFDDGGPEEIYGSQTPAKYAVFFENFSDLQSFAYMNYFGDNMKVVGLPSDTGTGPSATICGSFSITAGTPVEDGAYAFLEILLSEEVLTGINYSIPINRAAALQKVEKEKKDCLEAYRMYKNVPKSYLENSLQETCRMAGGFFPDSKTPDIFLETIENIETVSMCDSSVMMIVTEEIPPYLVGQKDIDSVISIINSRTQIVFDER